MSMGDFWQIRDKVDPGLKTAASADNSVRAVPVSIVRLVNAHVLRAFDVLAGWARFVGG